jgi:hypothetical protein
MSIEPNRLFFQLDTTVICLTPIEHIAKELAEIHSPVSPMVSQHAQLSDSAGGDIIQIKILLKPNR